VDNPMFAHGYQQVTLWISLWIKCG